MRHAGGMAGGFTGREPGRVALQKRTALPAPDRVGTGGRSAWLSTGNLVRCRRSVHGSDTAGRTGEFDPPDSVHAVGGNAGRRRIVVLYGIPERKQAQRVNFKERSYGDLKGIFHTPEWHPVLILCSSCADPVDSL
jgi:hypothetical protein